MSRVRLRRLSRISFEPAILFDTARREEGHTGAVVINSLCMLERHCTYSIIACLGVTFFISLLPLDYVEF